MPVEAEGWLRGALAGRAVFLVVGGSSRTSTIPGLTIAGPSPEATLYTPTLDLEYLLSGRPRTLDVIPVTPDGVPTPALVSRAALALVENVQVLAVDAGMAYEPLVPHIRLPSRRVGGRIDVEPALPPGTARRLFEEGRLLGLLLARGSPLVVVGETIPAGTTLAAAVLEALGYRAVDRVSSAGPSNPKGLKAGVVGRALRRLRGEHGVFDVVDLVGDPVHVSIAGVAAGALESGARVVLAGGTQMAAVLAIMRAARVPLNGDGVGVATTGWLYDDPDSDFEGLIRAVAGGVPVAVARVDLSRSRYPGLRAYERGYVKEGVGMGGALALALSRESDDRVVEAIEEEYARVAGAKA